jgi:hypothetical protein
MFLLSDWAKLIISILFGNFIEKSKITSLQLAIYTFFDKAKIDINNSLRLLNWLKYIYAETAKISKSQDYKFSAGVSLLIFLIIPLKTPPAPPTS